MAYLSDIPNAADIPATSQSQIKDNFGSINDSFLINHISFNDATNKGKHNYVTMPEVALTAPATDPTTAVNEMALYTKEVTTGGLTQSEMFLRNENNGDIINFTSAIKATDGTGSTVLPSGMILKWGRYNTGAVSGMVTITFGWGSPNPFPTACASVMVSGGRALGNSGASFDINFRVYEFDASSFKVVSYKNLTADRIGGWFNWFAIGY